MPFLGFAIPADVAAAKAEAIAAAKELDAVLQQQINVLKTDVAALKADVASLKTRVTTLEAGTPPPPPVDTTPPSVPTNFNAVPSSNSIALSWSASTDSVGVTGYVLTRNGTQIATPTGLSYNDTGLAEGTSYTYGVAAKDAAGNVSGAASRTASTTSGPPPPPTGNLLQVGMYSWGEAQTHKNQLKLLNAPIIRLGGTINDSLMSAILETPSKIMWTANGGSGGLTYSKTQTQAEIKQQLDRYGPNGSYFTANPSAPKRPIEAVELWNEPNFYLDNWSVNNVNTANIYKNIVNDNSPYIRQNWPGVKVVGPSVANASAAAEAFLVELFKVVPDLGTKLDAFSVHYYTAGGPPEAPVNESWGSWRVADSFASIKNRLNANGCGHLPIWNTEIGWPISQAEGGFYGGGGATKTQQAAYNVRADLMSVKLGHARMYHMFLVDTDGNNCGFMQANSTYPDPNAQPRPVMIATQHLISQIGSATSLEILQDNGPFVYRFTTPTGKVIAAWSDTPTTVNVPISGATSVTGMLGNAIASPSGSSYAAQLSFTPIWIRTQ